MSKYQIAIVASMAVLLSSLLLLSSNVTYADSCKPSWVATPTPGSEDNPAPGGQHRIPIPDPGSIEDNLQEFGVPSEEELRDNLKFDFFWSLEKWVTFMKAGRVGTWFAYNTTFGMWPVVVIMIVVLISLSFMLNNVFGYLGARARDEIGSSNVDRDWERDDKWGRPRSIDEYK